MTKTQLPFRTLAEHVQKAVDALTKRMRQCALGGINESAYLYYRKGQMNRDGELKFFLDNDLIDGTWTLGHSEGLRANVPFTSYFQWTSDRSKSLPIMGWQDKDTPETVLGVIADVMRNETCIISDKLYAEGANYWPSNLASMSNPERVGILDALAVGTIEALARKYPDQMRKLRPDLVEKELYEHSVL